MATKPASKDAAPAGDGAAVPDEGTDSIRMGDEETTPVTETVHSVGGMPGLSGASVSN
jgi:hypothetical protein